MNGQSNGEFHVPGTTTVRLVGGSDADRDELRRRLEAAGVSTSIVAGSDTSGATGSGATATAGVIRISSDGADCGSVEPADTATPDASDTTASDAAAAASDPPLIAVGSGVDVAAAYEAGATLAVPLAVADLPAAAIDRIADHIRQTAADQAATDLLNNAPLGAVVTDPETGEVIGCTLQCATLVGRDRSAGEFGLSDLTACGEYTNGDVVELVQEAAAGADTTAEFRDLPADAVADRLEVTFESATIAGQRVVVGWVRDVTERAAREEERQRYETILESLDDAVYAIAPDSTIEYVNEKYVSMKGVDRGEIVGTKLYEWVDEGPAKRAKEIRRQLRAGERKVGVLEYEFRAADGETTPAEIRFVEMPSRGEATGGAGVIRDISRRKSYERRLERQNERLEEFASVVSHDLRNPLSVASGRLELATEECDSGHLDAVADAHGRMAELIDGLLTLAREGDDVRELESIDLASLVETCWETVETGDAALTVDVEQSIQADPGRLQQLVANLIRNSIDHAGDDTTIAIGPIDDGDGFYIADDGPGIPPDDRGAVFDTGHSTDPEGTGFGLSIVKQVAEAHGWTLRLTDASGGGARFEFSGVAFAEE